MAAAPREERRLVGAGQISTRGHEERAAAHGRVDDAEREDVFG
jgi:hypothetical protein